MPQDRPGLYQDIYHSLVDHDVYLLLADFDEYCKTSDQLAQDYKNHDLWFKKAVINTAKSGIFSSDRTIAEYNDRIWHMTPFDVED